MARIVSARRAPFVRGVRRKTSWLGAAADTATTQLNANTLIIDQSLSAGELARRPFTIVRTRGYIYIQSNQLAAREEVHGALAFAVVSDQAVAAGGAAVPDPITNIDSDMFFVWQAFAFGQMPSSGTPAGVMIPFDSKAMRKVSDGEDVAVIVVNESSAFDLEFLLKFRQLIKLH